MKKLIGMTDFVLDKNKAFKGYDEYIRRLTLNYAKFLKQPLELWMFVPCKLVEGVWVVLEEPSPENKKYRMIVGEEKEVILDLHSFDCDVKEYQQAKERCLFDGFEYVPFSNSVKKGNYIIDFDYTENSNVESLLRHDIGFELTKPAQKQIGL